MDVIQQLHVDTWIKLLLFPTLVVLTVWIERWGGPAVAGAFSNLPFISGSVLIFNLVTHPRHAYIPSILGSLVAGIASMTFLVYYHSLLDSMSKRGRSRLPGVWRMALFLSAVVVYTGMLYGLMLLGMQTLMTAASTQPMAILGFFLLCYVCVGYGVRSARFVESTPTPLSLKQARVIFMIIIGTSFVLIFSAGSSLGLDPSVIGALSSVPVYLWSILVLAHSNTSDNNVLHLIRGFLIGSFGAVTFFTTMYIGVQYIDAWLPFYLWCPAAIVVTLGLQVVYLFYIPRFSQLVFVYPPISRAPVGST